MSRKIYRTAAVAILLVACHATPLAVTSCLARTVGPRVRWEAADLDPARFDPSWIQVKLIEGSEARVEDRRLVDDRFDLSRLRAVLERYGVVEVRPSFSADRATLRAMRSATKRPLPDLSLWFDLRLDRAGGPDAAARLLRELNRLDVVEIAHPAGIARPAGATAPAARSRTAPAAEIPDFSPRQGYLYAAPLGLDAPAAWWLPGGDGDGARIVDVEVAWTEEHVDFDPDLLFFDGGAPQDGLPLYSDHGTADLGIVIAKHDGRGIDGFAPRASWGVEALAPAEHPFAADRLLEAATQLRPGDLLLVELQMFPDGRGATPIEWLQANYDAIETIVYGLGIAVVEAAGNGGQDLDDPSWEGLFDRHIRDSGAILVAAGKPADLTAESFTNHGSRVDLHGWGSQIVTTGFGDLHGLGSPEIEYTATFNGTSGAAAMVSGAALCAASAYRAWRGAPLDPIRLRAILRETGTPHAGPLPIGPRPNLAAAIPATLDPSLLPADSLPAPPVARLLASPNPFRSGLTIRFWLARDAGVDLRVLDSSGRRIAQPFHGPLRAGPRTLAWDGRDDAGREAASGLYLLRVETDAGIPPPAARAVKIR